MINLFEPASNDYSLQYLYQIFGSMHGVIPTYAGFSAGQTLGVMFQTFNSVVLAVGVLIVVYVTIVGVVMTAQEGTFMGKKWNNLWIPLRMVLGIATLIPTSSGFCGIQVIMMWVIVQGIGAADVLWNTLIAKVENTGSVFATVTVPTTGAQFNSSFLFDAVMCTRAAYTKTANPGLPPNEGSDNAGQYYCAVNSGSFCNEPLGEVFPTAAALEQKNYFALGPDGSCGTLKIADHQAACADPSSLSCQISEAQINAIVSVIQTFDAVSESYIEIDNEYMRYYYQSLNYKSGPGVGSKPKVPPFVEKYCSERGITGECAPPKLPDPIGDWSNAPGDVIQDLYWPALIERMGEKANFTKTAADEYTAILGDVANNFIQEKAQQPGIDPALNAARSKGWIMAGSYYHLIANRNGSNQEESVPVFKVEMSQTNPPQGDGPLKNTRNNYGAAGNLKRIAAGQNPSTNTSDEMSSLLTAGGGDMHTALMITVNGQGGANPLAQLAQTGRQFLQIGFILFITQMALAIAMAIIGGISFLVLGSGPTGLGWIVDMLSKMLFPIMWIMIGLLMTIGATLGIYVPLIPYIIFTMAALGWIIATIEAMVAGPLVALGILSPSGQHELLGQAGPAIFLLFNIFLKPSLMIFGLIASMVLSSVAVQMVNAGFSTINDSITGDGGPLMNIFLTVAYVVLIISVLNKTFSLIHLLPERTLRWIGGQGFGDTGPEEALGAQKAMAGAAASQTTGAMRPVADTVTGASSSALKGMSDKQGQQKDAKLSGGGGGGGGGGGAKGPKGGK